jgi:hypothetical protein
MNSKGVVTYVMDRPVRHLEKPSNLGNGRDVAIVLKQVTADPAASVVRAQDLGS